MTKRKRQTAIYKTLRRKLKIEQHIPTKTGGELRWQGRVSSSCSTRDKPRMRKGEEKRAPISMYWIV